MMAILNLQKKCKYNFSNRINASILGNLMYPSVWSTNCNLIIICQAKHPLSFFLSKCIRLICESIFCMIFISFTLFYVWWKFIQMENRYYRKKRDTKRETNGNKNYQSRLWNCNHQYRKTDFCVSYGMKVNIENVWLYL